MSDDLFSQLFELFNAPGPVNWRLGAEIAKQLAGEASPVDPWLAEEYQDLARLAQLQIEAMTPLSPDPASNMEPLDRRGWILANLEAYGYLVAGLDPADSLDGVSSSDPMGMFVKPLVPALLGMQMGSFVGFLGHRVLGNFDAAYPTEQPAPLRVIVPNVEAFAVDHHLDAREVRLWSAIREVAHQSIYAIDWIRPDVLRRAADYVAGIGLDLSNLLERFQSVTDPTEIQSMMEDPLGLSGIFSDEHQRPALGDLHAIVATMAGYAEFLLDGMGRKLLPSLEAIRAAHRIARDEPATGEQLLDRLVGVEIGAGVFDDAAAFVRQVADRWGDDAAHRLLEGPDMVPSMDEISDPVAWAARVLLPDL